MILSCGLALMKLCLLCLREWTQTRTRQWIKLSLWSSTTRSTRNCRRKLRSWSCESKTKTSARRKLSSVCRRCGARKRNPKTCTLSFRTSISCRAVFSLSMSSMRATSDRAPAETQTPASVSASRGTAPARRKFPAPIIPSGTRSAPLISSTELTNFRYRSKTYSQIEKEL